MDAEFQADIDAVQRITALSSMLDAVYQMTEMGFSAVARVTENRWIACGVNDQMNFGLSPGAELDIRTTICEEIRQHHKAVVIENVDDDPVFCSHPTPLFYGFKSYISVPIVLPDKTFFGTLCAIDSKPRHLNTGVIADMFRLFAELVGRNIGAIKGLDEAVDRFIPRQQAPSRSIRHQIADHLLLARSLAASADMRSLRLAVEVALHLTATDARLH